MDYDFRNFQSTIDYQKVFEMLSKELLSTDSQRQRKAAEALAKVVNAASTQDNNKIKAILAQEEAKRRVQAAERDAQRELAAKTQEQKDKAAAAAAEAQSASDRDKMLGRSAIGSGALAAVGGAVDLIGGYVEDSANAKATDDERYARILASIKTPGYNQTAQSIYGDAPMDIVAKSLAEGKNGEAQVKRAKAATTANSLKRAGDILRALQAINDATRFAKSGTSAGTLLAAKGLASLGGK